MKHITFFSTIVLAILFLMPGCAQSEDSTTTATDIQEINITAKQFEFVPSEITVSEGSTVRLSIESVDVDHGFALTAFGVSENLQAGETTTVEFVADKTGTYSFFCNVFCGQGHGSMRGTLIVE